METCPPHPRSLSLVPSLQGSGAPQPCGAGTYLNYTQASADSECEACTKGMYCPGAAQCFPAGECDPGYYCPGSQTVANPAAYQCPIGFYCPQGTAWYVRPSAGYYTGQAGQDAPALCPAGYYCTLEDTCGAQCGDPLPSGNYTVPQDCPPGHYCPEGTSFAFEWPCPVGSYGPNMNLHNASQCELCPPGRYCPNAGMSPEIAYLCAPGQSVLQDVP